MSENSSAPGPNRPHPLLASGQAIANELSGIMDATTKAEEVAKTNDTQEMPSVDPTQEMPTADVWPPLHSWAKPDAVLPPPPVDIHQPEKRREIAVDRATVCLNGLRVAIAQRRLEKSIPKVEKFQRKHEARTEKNANSSEAERIKADLKSSNPAKGHAPKTHREMRASSRRTRRFQRGMKGGVDSWNSMDLHPGINQRLKEGLPVAREDRRTNRKAARTIRNHQERSNRVIGGMNATIEGHDSKSKRLAHNATEHRRRAYTASAHLQYLRQQKERQLDRLEDRHSRQGERLTSLSEVKELPQLFGTDIARADLATLESAIRTPVWNVRKGRIDRTRRRLEAMPVIDLPAPGSTPDAKPARPDTATEVNSSIRAEPFRASEMLGYRAAYEYAIDGIRGDYIAQHGGKDKVNESELARHMSDARMRLLNNIFFSAVGATEANTQSIHIDPAVAKSFIDLFNTDPLELEKLAEAETPPKTSK